MWMGRGRVGRMMLRWVVVRGVWGLVVVVGVLLCEDMTGDS